MNGCEFTYDGEFEMHLTVQAAGGGSLAEFQQWCDLQQMKCVQIVLSRGAHVQQPMATWRRDKTTLPVVVKEAQKYAASLMAQGVNVTRVKVEAAPFNQQVPLTDADTALHPPANYFEHHIKVKRSAAVSRGILLAVSEQHGAHLSHNAFKQLADGMEERFVTLRTYAAGRQTSMADLNALLNSLRAADENVVEHESEYCVYDSNIQLDDGWLPS